MVTVNKPLCPCIFFLILPVSSMNVVLSPFLLMAVVSLLCFPSPLGILLRTQLLKILGLLLRYSVFDLSCSWRHCFLNEESFFIPGLSCLSLTCPLMLVKLGTVCSHGSTHTPVLSSNQRNMWDWKLAPFDFAGTGPQILLQADLVLSFFSRPPYYFNLLFFASTAAVSLMTMFLSLKAYT